MPPLFPGPEKAVAVVTRLNGSVRELLVFRHPADTTELPKGTIESGEAILSAAVRELEEESGLSLTAHPSLIGEWERIVDRPFNGGLRTEQNLWHLCLFEPDEALPESWEHTATGSPAEDGLIFSFFWVPVGSDLPQKVHPLFGPVAQMIAEYYS